MHTGDLATMDSRGYLRIAGRLKEVIIRGGMNIFPREIEEALCAHPAVKQVAVLGIPDARWGEIIAAVVVPRDATAPPTPDTFHEHCRTHLASHKSPRRWFYVAELPLTPSGKVQKFALQQSIAAGILIAEPWIPSSAR